MLYPSVQKYEDGLRRPEPPLGPRHRVSAAAPGSFSKFARCAFFTPLRDAQVTARHNPAPYKYF